MTLINRMQSASHINKTEWGLDRRSEIKLYRGIDETEFTMIDDSSNSLSNVEKLLPWQLEKKYVLVLKEDSLILL